MFHAFHGLMNSINWPASSVWVFIAQLGEHCSANAEAMGSNPVEAPKTFFSGYFGNCLNCDSLRWSHTHFICISAVHIISFSTISIVKVKRCIPTGEPVYKQTRGYSEKYIHSPRFEFSKIPSSRVRPGCIRACESRTTFFIS